MNRARAPYRLLAPVIAASFALAACGSGSKGDAAPANPDLVVTAVAGLKFDKSSYSAAAGDVAIEYDNSDVQVHTMVIEDAKGNKVPGWTRLVAGSHQKKGGTVKLAAGSYKIICDIHAGMTADLAVT